MVPEQDTGPEQANIYGQIAPLQDIPYPIVRSIDKRGLNK